LKKENMVFCPFMTAQTVIMGVKPNFLAL